MIPDDVYISPSYTTRDYRSGSVDAIALLEDQVKGWLFIPADTLRAISSSPGADSERHNGIALLALLLMFFEPHGQYLQGANSGRSQETFSKAFRSYVDFLNKSDASQAAELVSRPLKPRTVYDLARCGLFHGGAVKKGILVEPDMKGTLAFRFDSSSAMWVVNPWPLLTSLQDYFNDYISQLRNAPTSPLRMAFDTMSRSLLPSASTGSVMSTLSPMLNAKTPISGGLAPH